MASIRQPATRKHALTFYDALAERAEFSEEAECLIFEGSLIEVFRGLGISNAYYTFIRTILMEGEDPCLVVVRPGARGFSSLVALRHPPDPAEDLTAKIKAATIPVADLERRLVALEEWRESLSKGGLNIVEALRDMELRLNKLSKPSESPQTGGNGVETP